MIFDTSKHSARQSRQHYNAIGVAAVDQIRPIRIDAYLDQIQFWMQARWDDRQMRKVGARYGTPVYVATDQHGNPKPPLRVGGIAYQQCLHAELPTWEFIEALAEFNPYPNQIEFAHDLSFSSAQETNHAEETFDHYAIKKNCGKQSVAYVTDKKDDRSLPRKRDKGLVTRYIGDRRIWDANVLLHYCRIPKLDPLNHEFALHNEWVVSGAPALRRIGINKTADILALDRRQFWKKRLLLADIDRGALGRRWHNYLAGRRVWCSDPVHDGDALYRAAQQPLHPFSHSGNSQNVICRYQRTEDDKPFLSVVSHCLINLPAEHLLPSPGSFLRRQEPATTAYTY